MKKLSAIFWGAVALLALTSTAASAQVAWVSGGYTVQGWRGDNWNDFQGFGADFGYRFHKTSRTAGAFYVDFSRNAISTDIDEETDTAVVGGFREFFLTDKRIQPFAHASIGNMHWVDVLPFDDRGNDLLLGGGFGAMYKITDAWGAKAQWDFWKPREDGVWSDPISRWYFAAVYSWGGK